LSLNVRFGYLLELIFLLNINLLLNLRDNLNFLLEDKLLNDFLDNLCHWLHLHSLCVDIHWNSPFHLDGDGNFDRFIDDSIDKFDLAFFDRNSDNFINMHSDRYFMLLYDHSLFDDLLYLDFCASLKISDENLVSWYFNWAINCEINKFFYFYFNWSFNIEVLRDIVVNRRHLNWNLNYFFNYLFDNLRNLNDSLDDSRHDHNFLNDPFDFNAFGHFYDLLNDLLLGSWNLFDLFEVDFLRNNFLFPDHNWHFFPHYEGHIPDDLYRLLFCEDNVFYDLNWNVFFHLDSFYEWNLMNLGFYLGLGHNDGDFNVFLHLSDLYSCFIDDPGNLDFDYLDFFHYL
jgi:hypothetical protein